MYNCGPTVYDYVHVGNLRSYVFADTLRRVLEWNDYKVKQIINITDFGHLTSDADEGEDKMTKALVREGLSFTLENTKKVAEKYTKAFLEDIGELNIESAEVYPRASEHIPEQIAYIQTLLDKGYAYKTSDGIYFDVAKFPAYGILGGVASAEHSRVGVNPEKHDSRDFSLWKNNADVGWDAPWGKGFPGWHIECTAMSTKYLGKSFDIHTGGVDHIPVHHNNEIAQAEAATGKQYVKYWLHHDFITIDAQKVAKSVGNTITLKQLKDRGIMPLALRYWFLTASYHQVMNFTWEAIEGAQTAYLRAMRVFVDLPAAMSSAQAGLQGEGEPDETYTTKFQKAINDDLNTAEAIAVLWELLKDEKIHSGVKRATVVVFDAVLGLNFEKSGDVASISVVSTDDIPEEVHALLEQREAARKEKRFEDSDALRTQIHEQGFDIEDTVDGPVLRKI